MSNIKNIQLVDRWQNNTNSDGYEIKRKFFVQPYEACQDAASLLLGKISGATELPDGTSSGGVIQEPDVDSYCPGAYCVNVEMEHVHEDAVKGSPIINIGQNDTIDQIKTALHVKEKLQGGSETGVDATSSIQAGTKLGIYLTATYKPLIFNTPSNDNDEHYTTWRYEKMSKWDWVNVKMDPINKIANVGKEVKFLVEDKTTDILTLKIPLVSDFIAALIPYPRTDADAFVTQPMKTVTVTRKFVANVPWNIINQCAGKINSEPLDFGRGFKFPAQCLRFDCPQIEQIPYTDENGANKVYYNITYYFTFNSIFDEYYDEINKQYRIGWVSWNRAIGTPMSPITKNNFPAIIANDAGGSGYGALQISHTSYYPVGSVKGTSALISGTKPLYLLDSTVAGFSITNQRSSEKTFKNLFYSDET